MKSKRDWLVPMEDLLLYHGEFLVSSEMIPARRNQVEGELMQFQKELASEIYLQRDKERWL